MKSRLGPGSPEFQRGSESILGRKLDERLESCEERDVTKGEREAGCGWSREPGRAVRAAAAGSPGGAAWPGCELAPGPGTSQPGSSGGVASDQTLETWGHGDTETQHQSEPLTLESEDLSEHETRELSVLMRL